MTCRFPIPIQQEKKRKKKERPSRNKEGGKKGVVHSSPEEKGTTDPSWKLENETRCDSPTSEEEARGSGGKKKKLKGAVAQTYLRLWEGKREKHPPERSGERGRMTPCRENLMPPPKGKRKEP